MKNKAIILYVLFFMFGWIFSTMFTLYFYAGDYDIQLVNPYGGNSNSNSITGNAVQQLGESSLVSVTQELDEAEENLLRDKPSPGEWIRMDKISVYDNEVILKIDNPQWAIFTDTKSMDPIIDSTSKAIEVIPSSEAQIKVGDIVAYKSRYKEGIITHRVVETGSDAFGWFARVKGDNNDNVDPGKIRFEQIQRVVVAVIY